MGGLNWQLYFCLYDRFGNVYLFRRLRIHCKTYFKVTLMQPLGQLCWHSLTERFAVTHLIFLIVVNFEGNVFNQWELNSQSHLLTLHGRQMFFYLLDLLKVASNWQPILYLKVVHRLPGRYIFFALLDSFILVLYVAVLVPSAVGIF